MPTGYTHKLCEGEQSFRDFALDCARAFGALVTMRDEPSDAAIPDEFKPAPFYQTQVDKYRAALAKAEAMAVDQCLTAAIAEYEQARDYNAEQRKKQAAKNIRLARMRDAVLAWTPPTADHTGMRDFMLEQLKMTIDFDGGEPYLTDEVKLAPEAWRAKEIAKAAEGLARAIKSQAEEIERVESRNDWLKTLRASLPAK